MENTNNSAIFERFQWHDPATDNASLPGIAVMHFASGALDIGHGARTILEMIERDDMTGESGERTILDPTSRAALMRMAISSLAMLGNSAESLISWAYEHHTPEGRRAK